MKNEGGRDIGRDMSRCRKPLRNFEKRFMTILTISMYFTIYVIVFSYLILVSVRALRSLIELTSIVIYRKRNHPIL